MKDFGIKWDRAVTVDLGINGLGWAYFEGEGPPVASGVCRPRRCKTWIQKAEDTSTQFAFIRPCRNTALTALILEWPELWSGDAKSHAAAEKGDLQKLAYQAGFLHHAIGCEPILVKPREWKGQLSKPEVIRRIVRVWPNLKKMKDHEADAIGMGLGLQKGL